MPAIPKGFTRYQQHVEKWGGCERCPLYQRRRHVVLARGTVPSPLLFVGEAPGVSEDVGGIPFHGPAGKLLDQMINDVMYDDDLKMKYAMTNVISCIPRGSDNKKTETPPDFAINACRPRLNEFIKLCQPKLIICVGKVAAEAIYDEASNGVYGDDIRVETIDHPAYILRAPQWQQGLIVQQNCVKLGDAIAELKQGM